MVRNVTVGGLDGPLDVDGETRTVGCETFSSLADVSLTSSFRQAGGEKLTSEGNIRLSTACLTLSGTSGLAKETSLIQSTTSGLFNVDSPAEAATYR